MCMGCPLAYVIGMHAFTCSKPGRLIGLRAAATVE
ncbi:hypothetical protein EV649_5078 [Kribbella sp. VKM Ac-2569]|nr:hypothetical protein EV649_5078 [Kribbella sp. VKM Ac-2569]